MTSKLQKNVSTAIRRLRQDRRWNQAELAKKLGVSQSRLSEIESGKGSISAEQLIILMQTFNVPLSHFVKTKPADPDAQLRNAIARLGGNQLTENPDALPSEKFDQTYTVIIETLIGGTSSRLIAGLVPVVINNIQSTHLDRILKKLSEYKLENRLLWVIEGIIGAMDKRMAVFTPREQSLIYRKAKTILENFYRLHISILRPTLPEDILDSDITSQKTLDQIKESRDNLARRWHIVTRITADDFYQSLLAAEHNA